MPLGSLPVKRYVVNNNYFSLARFSMQMRERRDGSLELRLETSIRKDLTRSVLSWVPYVRVWAPAQFRRRGEPQGGPRIREK